jgi:hypothetical protein
VLLDYFRFSATLVLIIAVGVAVALLIMLSRWLTRDE